MHGKDDKLVQEYVKNSELKQPLQTSKDTWQGILVE
jgi:hypothetical protein